MLTNFEGDNWPNEKLEEEQCRRLERLWHFAGTLGDFGVGNFGNSGKEESN